MAPIHPRSSSPSKAPSANRSESVTNELTSSIASGIVCHADGMCAMASMRMRAASPSTSSVSSRKFRMRVFTGPASPRVAAPAAIAPAQSCEPVSCVLSVHPLSLNSRWSAVYPILTQWEHGQQCHCLAETGSRMYKVRARRAEEDTRPPSRGRRPEAPVPRTASRGGRSTVAPLRMGHGSKEAGQPLRARNEPGHEARARLPSSDILSASPPRLFDLGQLLLLEDHLLVFAGVHEDGVALVEPALEHFLGQRVLHQPLDGPPQRPGAELRIVAFLDQQLLGRLGELHVHAPLRELLGQVGQHDVDDPPDVFLVQRVEHDDLVDAVQELGPERAAQLVHDLLLHVLMGLLLVFHRAEADAALALDFMRPHV